MFADALKVADVVVPQCSTDYQHSIVQAFDESAGCPRDLLSWCHIRLEVDLLVNVLKLIVEGFDVDSRRSPYCCHHSKVLFGLTSSPSACSTMTYRLEERQIESGTMTGIKIDLRWKRMILKLMIGVLLGRIASLLVGIQGE